MLAAKVIFLHLQMQLNILQLCVNEPEDFRLGVRKFFLIMTLVSLVNAIASITFADRARFIWDPGEAMQVRTDLVQQARHEILVEYFSIWNDEQSAGGIALLIDAARRGVKVKVVLDALAHRVPTSVFAAMNQMARRPDGTPGIEVRMYNDVSLNLFALTKRDHSKMIIVDGKRLLTGGRNIGAKYFHLNKKGEKRNYDDFDILVEGNVVPKAHRNFMTTWNSGLVTPPRLGRLSEDQLSPAHCFYTEGSYESCADTQAIHRQEIADQAARLDKTLLNILKNERGDLVRSNTGTDWIRGATEVGSIQFLSHDPKHLVSRKTAFLTDEMLKLLSGAKHNVDITSPYVIPTKEVMSVFAKLLARGVEIRVTTNSLYSTDNIFAQAGYRYLKNTLIKIGVEIHEYKGPDTLHTKMLVIDDQVANVGTSNFDPRSFHLNREIGLTFQHNPVLTQEIRQQMEFYRSKSVVVAKNGTEQNHQWQDEQDARSGKAAYVGLLQLLVPFFIHQL